MEALRRGARWAVGGGVVLVVLGLLAAVVQLQRDDAELLTGGLAPAPSWSTSTATGASSSRRDGGTVQATESTKSGTEQPAVGEEDPDPHDRDDPTRIVLVTSHTARNVTLWIVAVKFLVGGAVLVVLGARRLRRSVPA